MCLACVSFLRMVVFMGSALCVRFRLSFMMLIPFEGFLFVNRTSVNPEMYLWEFSRPGMDSRSWGQIYVYRFPRGTREDCQPGLHPLGSEVPRPARWGAWGLPGLMGTSCGHGFSGQMLSTPPGARPLSLWTSRASAVPHPSR